MRMICLILWFIFVGVHSASPFVKVRYVYLSEGKTVILKCLPDAFNVDWMGPSHTNATRSYIEERDIYGKNRNWTISTYFNRNSFNPSLPHLNRLKIVVDRDAGHYDLEIKNVSLFDEGFYRCDIMYMNGTFENLLYILQIKALPSEMNFVNSTNGKITGIEQKPIIIVCRVKRGKPPEKLTLKKDGIIINTTTHGIVEHTFTPDRMDNNKQFLCEAISDLTSSYLRKTLTIEIKYKPVITFKRKIIEVNEGRTISLCSSIDSNPMPNGTWWSKGYNKLDSYDMISSCYDISNITRNDNGAYTCTAMNELGEASKTLTVVVRYPPNVKLEYTNVTFDIRERKMQCTAEDGLPTDYTYSHWEHRSEYNENIRYLNSTSTGNLTLPNIESNLKRYQDSGIYICRATNGIPDKNNNYEQEGKGFFVSEGPPVIVDENSQTPYEVREQQTILKLNVLSYSDISCTHIRKLHNQKSPIDNMRITIASAKIKGVFHGKNVSVNGFEVVFHFTKLRKYNFQLYTITVCNVFGNQSYMVELHSFEKEESLSYQGIVIIILLVIIFILVAWIGIYVRHLKQKIRKRMISAINDDTSDRIDTETAHYIEINDGINVMTTSQENNVTDERTNLGNRDITREPMEHISVSSGNESNPSEYLDDGYEKPYTTLMETNRVDDGHVYLVTNMRPGNDKSIAFDNASCEQALICTEQNLSLENIKSNEYMNYEQNDIKLKSVENYLYEVESDIQAQVYPDDNKAQYVNLSLKQ